MKLEMVQQFAVNKEMENGVSSVLGRYWEYVLECLELPFEQYCIELFYTVYAHFTIFNLMIFLIKFIPTTIYMHKFIKNFYSASRERLKQQQIELEDIKLQIQIVNTKLKLRDAEFAERGELLRRKVEQLRIVRKRVQEIIGADDELRDAISGDAEREGDAARGGGGGPGEEDKFIVELLKELKSDRVSTPERDRMKMNCGERLDDPVSTENSVYSSANDNENKQDYHVKIVKVTNVYKVAYLRHFIKQKRLRRANKQALLKKKIDNIKKLLEDWQKTLKMVINNELSLLTLDPQHLEIASQRAMGDFSKSKFNNSSDSDSDFRNSCENYQDDYCVSWSQNQYRPACNYDDFNMNFEVKRECYDLDECCNNIFTVPEETNSQIKIEEITSD